ncbi:DNA translocase FtsK [Pseudomonas sp. SA3-5]|uniref:DNA translocase FtsK n=1 Tax=Pseudomonas aestuarii TaxID=3018340 RepID=A0ABT4XEC1_9PSED|nr:DNA translocase FtsK [Pseudomonas aestuarii]MDA7086536.1 DNA translocase FtsK [Pseudomonas aestuarii]
MQVNQPQGGDAEASTLDPLYREAMEHVISNQRASVSVLQRRLAIGYNRASLLMDELERAGIVSGINSDGARCVLVLEVPHA